MTKKDWFIFAGLYGLVLVVFGQTLAYGWISIDDGLYVYENPHVRAGLTRNGVVYAFTQSHGANWHPLTTLSHMLDVELFGLQPQRHHLQNFVFHLLNSLLLYVLLKSATGNRGPSAFVAAIFAVHPLHVESVAWISIRKDGLSTFFWFSSMLAYLRYAKQPDVARYAVVAGLFALGLMSKPMVVTLPLVLLLFDVWPLRRLSLFEADWISRSMRLIAEKIPLFLLSILSGLATIWAQSREGAVSSLELIPMKERVLNAIVSYCLYMKKTLLPTDLSVFYPHLGHTITFVQAGVALAILLLISIAAVAFARRAPYVFAGWMWFLISLVPVIGIVQVGFQGMADRYMYVPIVGILLAIAWSAAALTESKAAHRTAIGIAGALCVIACAVLAFQQTRLWRSSTALWAHAVAQFPNDARCQNALGSALLLEGRVDEALVHIKHAMELDNKIVSVNSNMGQALAEQGRFDEAIAYYRLELGFDPTKAHVRVNLGNALVALERFSEAQAEFQKAIQANPNLPDAHNGLGVVHLLQSRFAESLPHFETAAHLAPESPEAPTNLAVALDALGRRDEAIAACRRALAANPNFQKARLLVQKLEDTR